MSHNLTFKKTMNLSKLIVVLAGVGMLAGCVIPPSATPTDAKNALTTGQVQITLKKDVTTQTEVVEVFGAPNLVTLNSEGVEVWTVDADRKLTI